MSDIQKYKDSLHLLFQKDIGVKKSTFIFVCLVVFVILLSGGGKKTSIGDAKLLKGRDRFRFPLLYADPLRPALDEELKTRQKVIIRINTVKKLLLPIFSSEIFHEKSFQLLESIEWKKSRQRGAYMSLLKDA